MMPSPLHSSQLPLIASSNGPVKCEHAPTGSNGDLHSHHLAPDEAFEIVDEVLAANLPDDHVVPLSLPNGVKEEAHGTASFTTPCSVSPLHVYTKPSDLINSIPSEEEDNFPLVTAHYASDSNQQSDSEDEDTVLLPATIDSDDNEIPVNSTDHNSFWLYKRQQKGPKPRHQYKLNASHPTHNPHSPITFKDPVFDKSQKLDVRHFGKARLGEANDVTPNPEKLCRLGKDIERIQRELSALTDDMRKEKMKLSSRLCRMKRSANHEANKIKLAGLEQEREELSSVIRSIQEMKSKDSISPSLEFQVQQLRKQMLKTKVAGRSSTYVNETLENTNFDYYNHSDYDWATD